MRRIAGWGMAALLAVLWAGLRPAAAQAPDDSQQLANSNLFLIRSDHWSASDERGYSAFIAALGGSGCHTVNGCLHDPANPFHATDPNGIVFYSDCAEFPYVLRAYYAFKRGLPFSYVSGVAPRGRTRDIRYTKTGNEVVERHDVLSGSTTGYSLLNQVEAAVSSAVFRIDPDLDNPAPDFYSPALKPGSIRPGTMFYDPNGHVGTVYKVDADGRIYYFDAHPDGSVTHGIYDERFVRSRPAMGAGFKNWRPLQLLGYTKRTDGVLMGGHVVMAANAQIPDFSTVQYYGTGARPTNPADWASGGFMLKGQPLGYYDYVRAELAGGVLRFDPLQEVAEMVDANCNDLHDRVAAVDAAIKAGISAQPEPDQLPANIYGADGDWEDFATPARDARLKTAFIDLRRKVERFVTLWREHDPALAYHGQDLIGDMARTYSSHAGLCTIAYMNSQGALVRIGYEEARRRLFLMSFDPYQCVERRWGAHSAEELATCADDARKTARYKAEQTLRNQVQRDDGTSGAGDGESEGGPARPVAVPETDVIAYLRKQQAQGKASRGIGTPVR